MCRQTRPNRKSFSSYPAWLPNSYHTNPNNPNNPNNPAAPHPRHCHAHTHSPKERGGGSGGKERCVKMRKSKSIFPTIHEHHNRTTQQETRASTSRTTHPSTPVTCNRCCKSYSRKSTFFCLLRLPFPILLYLPELQTLFRRRIRISRPTLRLEIFMATIVRHFPFPRKKT